MSNYYTCSDPRHGLGCTCLSDDSNPYTKEDIQRHLEEEYQRWLDEYRRKRRLGGSGAEKGKRSEERGGTGTGKYF